MTRKDLDAVLDWAAAEGWNPGLDDADAFLAADPDGFFVAVDDDNTPVASISVVRHCDDFAFLGLYLCRTEYRGMGIGYALWQHGLTHAGHRTIALDGVPAQQDNYRKSGFRSAGETIRYCGAWPGRPSAGVRGAHQRDLPALVRLEGKASGVVKTRYMSVWLAGAPTRRTLVLERNNEPRGLATVRSCRSGFKVGPLFAPDIEGARELLDAAIAQSGDEISIDVPSTARELCRLCEDAGLRPAFRTARMYKGNALPPSPDLFAVGTLELG